MLADSRNCNWVCWKSIRTVDIYLCNESVFRLLFSFISLSKSRHNLNVSDENAWYVFMLRRCLHSYLMYLIYWSYNGGDSDGTPFHIKTMKVEYGIEIAEKCTRFFTGMVNQAKVWRLIHSIDLHVENQMVVLFLGERTNRRYAKLKKCMYFGSIKPLYLILV